MKKMLNNMAVLLVAGLAVLTACSNDVSGGGLANGTITDPNADVDRPSGSVIAADPDSAATEYAENQLHHPVSSSSGELVPQEYVSSSDVSSDTLVVVPADSCTNDLGESICPSELLNGEGDVLYESDHCLVKTSEAVGFKIGVLFTNGREFIQMEESFVDYENPDLSNEFSKTLGMYLAEERWDLCKELLGEFESYTEPRLDSLEIWGTSGGLALWDDNGCDNGTVNRVWYQYILPAGIKEELSQKAEQYKSDCIRWESNIQ